MQQSTHIMFDQPGREHDMFNFAPGNAQLSPSGIKDHGLGDGQSAVDCDNPRHAGFFRKEQAYALRYFTSTASMAFTLFADRPSGSKVDSRKASAMSLASSGPMTRAPIVMICALFEVAAFFAE